MDNNTNINNVPKKRDCSGERNGFFGKRHSMESRMKQSASHKAYQQRIHQNQSNTNGQSQNYVQQPMTMQQFLQNSPQLDIKGYIQSLMKEEAYKNIIREEIEKFIWKEQKKQRISIPL